MFDLETMERRYRQMRRATVARSALDVIAMIFLGCGFAFWGVAFWQLLAPPAILSLLSIQAAVLALVYSLAAPLLLSMLVPTTPAGQLLQKTQWRTIGFPVIIGCALFLTYQAWSLIELWLSAQQGVAEGHFEGPLALSLTIAFVVVPALAWVQLTPERWVQQIQQAHQVKKLEIQQRGELAILKASLLRAKLLAARGWADLLPEERFEAIGSTRGLLMSIGDTQRDIVRTLGMSAELERDIVGDREVADHIDYVAHALDVSPPSPAIPAPPQRMRDLSPAESQRVIDQAFTAAEQNAIPAAPQPRPTAAGNSSPQRPAALRSAPQRYAVEYATAAQAFGSGLFNVAALAETLDMKDRTARDRLNVWLADGRAAKSETQGHFYLTDREVR
jgi:hypothetical protein